MAAAPCAMKARAISTASSAVMPPGTQSAAEIRTVTGTASPPVPVETAVRTASRTASKTSSGNRSRFSSGPP